MLAPALGPGDLFHPQALGQSGLSGGLVCHRLNPACIDHIPPGIPQYIPCCGFLCNLLSCRIRHFESLRRMLTLTPERTNRAHLLPSSRVTTPIDLPRPKMDAASVRPARTTPLADCRTSAEYLNMLFVDQSPVGTIALSNGLSLNQ